MNYVILASILIASAAAQRPSFAGSSPKGVPDVAARFKTEGTSDVAPQDFVNRLGSVDAPTQRIPIDARGDVNLVNRIKTWPDENKPFWYVNAEAIEKQRGSPVRGNNYSGSQPISNIGNQGSTVSNNQFENRFGASSQPGPEIVGNSFNVVVNNQWKTYVYDPVADAWFAKRN